MDIDLIAGLVKPKTSLNERPQLETAMPADTALPDFTALLRDTVPEGSTDAATLEMPVPPEAILDQDTAQIIAGTESSPQPDPEAAAPAEKAELPKDNPPTPTPELGLLPFGLMPEPAATSPSTPDITASTTPILAAETPAAIGISAAILPEQKPILQARLEPDAKTPPQGKPEHLPAIQTSEMVKPQPAPKMPIQGFVAAPIDEPSRFQRMMTPETPKVDAKVMPAKLTAKASGQTVALSAPTVGFTNVDAATDTPDQTHFSLKIDHQTTEIAPTSRSAPQATPVASQISTQLPHLLTKAEKQTVELRLDPPELGRVTIHLSTNDQQITAHVVADRPDTVDLMRRHAELLTATLAQAGFSQADLSFQHNHGQNSETETEPFQQLSEISESDELAMTSPTRARQDGRLDIRL